MSAPGTGRTDSVVQVSRTRTERLVNLVICLLSTRRFLTAAQIAATVPGYEHDPEDAARPRGVPAQVRAGQGRAARAGRAAGDRHRQRLRHRARLPHRPPRLRAARHPAGARTRRPRSASPPGCGSTPAWPRPPPPGWPSCAPPASTWTRRPPSGVEPVVTVDPAFAPLHRRGPGPPGGHASTTACPRTTPPTHPPAAAVGRGLLARPVVRGRATTSTATPTRCFRLSRVVGARARWSARRARTSRRPTST